MLDDREVRRSKAIQRRTGRTFYFATRLLPERVRHPTYVLYAFFRIADEIVDSEAAARRPAAEQARQIDRLREQILGDAEPEDPVIDAFCTVKAAYDIPDEEVETFLDAMATDIEKSRYENFEELREYMRGSAAAVGVMMTAVMNPKDRERALPHARALGEAFQMSNFLRDVREDIVDRDRIYLPQETLRRRGVSEEDVENLEFSPAFAAAIRDELRRTEELYREGVAGIEHLPEDCQFAVLLAAVLYADHHRSIRDCGCDVLNNEPSLSTTRKLSLWIRTRLRWQRNRDPEAVFRAVSDVRLPETPARPPEPGGTLPTR